MFRVLIRKLPRAASLKFALRRGHDHHGPNMPPFARLAPPTESLPEEVELVWDDMVAPEACIDLDLGASVDSTEILQGWMCLGAFFTILGGYIYLTDPVGSNPVALRSTVIPFGGLRRELGLPEVAAEGSEDEEEDSDDDHDDDE